ncbi:hypothetical protein B6D12_13075 [Gilliamella apicola]|uniref:hypothetical protein n=1 Tax=Gilliamella apicola TaxID=1196095 RepID=UPI000A32F542|nr:hypothetical protein [Gilliamella apicola]OTP87007.1 hypothetical protein B5S41_12965 [Gilliamella apicola]OTP92631.1 hypothetical protein B6D13_12150 [Gilliamella apicola]OTQ02941.1 hypothetical protein B6D07_03705 [Gilliamella apicola]OTQ03716.1 hypothetical protein B6D12_13075 [Gilliamella apicola]OTQ14130.1 hypothetical protein B6D16_12495 [Gilliamella apicola]
MKLITISRHIKRITYTLLLLQFSNSSYGYFTSQTAQTIQGSRPSLSQELEMNIDNFQLFGLIIENRIYYSQKEIAEIPIPTAYPFVNRIGPSIVIKQPDENEFFDRDGDKLDYLVVDDDISMVWYYTDANNNDIEFTPKDYDTFCSLAAEKKYAPFKVKLSADLVLFSKYGDPDNNTYPNNIIKTQPSVIYTVVEDVGVCFARPELKPNTVAGSDKDQWDPKYGFLTQSNIDPTKNFPTTGFYGAKFDLILSSDGIVNNYNWHVKQGSELVNIDDSDANVVTVLFNGPDAQDTEKAWEHVMGSENGYKVIIEGVNKTNNKKIHYAFTITKWFDAWKQNMNTTGLISVLGTVAEVVAECEAKKGHYQLSNADEISNAVLGSKGSAQFTREIGKLISEWGEATQKSYPGSFAPHTGGTYKRFYVWEPTAGDDGEGKVCDIHIDTGIYHCRANEKENKNGVCASIPK